MDEIRFCPNPYCRNEPERHHLCQECLDVFWRSPAYEKAAGEDLFNKPVNPAKHLFGFIGKQVRAKGGI